MAMLVSSFHGIESPVRPIAEPDRWALPRDMDSAVSMKDAALGRAKAMTQFGHGVARGAAWLWRKAVLGPIERWAERERLMRELSYLSERELIEIGISPGMIPFVVAGKFHPEAGSVRGERAPANENRHPRKAA